MNKIQQNKQSKYNKKLVRESLFIEKILMKMVNDNNPLSALGQVKSLWKTSRNKNIIEKFYYYDIYLQFLSYVQLELEKMA